MATTVGAKVKFDADAKAAMRALRDMQSAFNDATEGMDEMARRARAAEEAMDAMAAGLPNKRLANFSNIAMGAHASLSILGSGFRALRDSTERYFQSQEDGQELWDELERNAREIVGSLFELVIGTDDAEEAFRRASAAIDAANAAMDIVLRTVGPLANAIRGPLVRALEAFGSESEQARRELAAMEAQLENAETAARGYEDAMRSLAGDPIQQAQGALDALTGATANYEHGLHIQIGTIEDMVRITGELGTVSIRERDRILSSLGSQSDAFSDFQRNARQALDPLVTRLAETGDGIETLRGETIRFTQSVTGADGLTRNVEFAVPALDLLNETMINGQPAAEQLATNLDLLNRGYQEQAYQAEAAADGTASAEDAFIDAGAAVDEEYNPAIRRALELLRALEPARAKAVALMQAEKDAAIASALAFAERNDALKAGDALKQAESEKLLDAEIEAHQRAAAATKEAFDQRVAAAQDFTSAMSASFASVVSGQQSAMEAIRQFLGQELIARGTRYALEATALAFVPGLQGQAAGLGAAAAAMIAGGAALSGSGAGGAGGGAASSGLASATPEPTQTITQSTTIQSNFGIVGDQRQAARLVADSVRTAQREGYLR
jgi:hypothetical protein